MTMMMSHLPRTSASKQSPRHAASNRFSLLSCNLLAILWILTISTCCKPLLAADPDAAAEANARIVQKAKPTKPVLNKKDSSGDDESANSQQCTEQNSDGTCKVRMVSIEELATKTGKDGGKELWLSILGKVYDVSAGPEFYGARGSYSIFAGRDATVPFVTGKFTEEEALKGTEELTDAQLYSLDREWGSFYDSGNEGKYSFVGFLCCRYYTEGGIPTEETIQVNERVKSYGVIKEKQDAERKAKRQALRDKRQKEREERFANKKK